MAENSLFKTVLTKAMAQCSRRELCSDDIRRKLLLWGIGNNDSDKIISILIEENFIDESRYAVAFVKDKFNFNKWGKVKIASSLQAKKIPPEAINVALDSIDNKHYTNILEKLIADHRRKVKAKNNYDLKAKLLRYGLSKGFESSLLYDILNDLED